MEYLIYRIKNKKNGKCYVGKTGNLEERMKTHRHNPCCRYLYQAIKKYGWENFEVEILQRCSKEDASILEYEYILRENTLAPNGYNLILETNHGRIFTEEMREKTSRSLQGGKRRDTNSTKKYIGVRKRRDRAKFDVRLTKGHITYGKSFLSETEAAEAYDRIALFIYGSEAKINFPHKRAIYLSEDLEKYFNWFMTKRKKSSNYKGVSFHLLTKKWYAYYYENKKQVRLGLFNTEEEAIEKIRQYNESVK